MSSVVEPSGKKRAKTGGRKAGVPNKITKDLRDMVMGALDSVGGEAYLAEQATESPAAFMALVGRCLPKDVNLKASITLSDLLRQAREKHGR